MTALHEAVAERAHESDLPHRLRELVALLRDRLPDATPQAETPLRVRWMEYRAQLTAAYVGLSKSLDAWSIHVPSLRPTNYARNLFHVASATTGLLVIEITRDPLTLLVIASVFALFAWSCETSRRFSDRANEALMRLFGKVAHPHERYRVNSATWYATALLVLSLTVPPMVAGIAVAILGIADPAAAIVGRRWGTIRLVHGRSLQGTLAFVGAGFALAAGLLLTLHGELSVWAALAVAGAATVPAALAELFSRRVDDNFSIPVAAGAGAMAALHALGLA
jgi:dolichol kinase